MAKRFSFYREKRPTWEIELGDEARTVLHLIIPTKGLMGMVGSLMDRLNTISGEDEENETDIQTIENEIYEIAAELISRNEEQLTVTAQELGEKYDASLDYLIVFFHGYVEFINENIASKN